MIRPRILIGVALAVAAGCATTPLAWQRPDTGARASAAEIAECRDAAVLEVNQRWPFGWYGPQPRHLRWRHDPLWFGYFPHRYAFADLSRLELIQELTGFCLRLKGYRLLPAPLAQPEVDQQPVPDPQPTPPPPAGSVTPM